LKNNVKEDIREYGAPRNELMNLNGFSDKMGTGEKGGKAFPEKRDRAGWKGGMDFKQTPLL